MLECHHLVFVATVILRNSESTVVGLGRVALKWLRLMSVVMATVGNWGLDTVDQAPLVLTSSHSEYSAQVVAGTPALKTEVLATLLPTPFHLKSVALGMADTTVQSNGHLMAHVLVSSHSAFALPMTVGS